MQYPIPYGSYTLLESIGKGGMSAIELAQTSVADAQYLRFLVIKRMQNHLVEDDSYIRMFQDEARINSELQHANIAQVYDFGQNGDEFFIAMEYIPGVDLRELQKSLASQRRGLPIRITLRIVHDVLAALEYAHTRVDTFGKPMNIVHRDVNPRNVMLSIRGEVKLIDFGVAKAETKLDKTVGHMLKGKFAYMSPEQFEGATVDGRSDLFAVGLMLHEMVEGVRPFRGLSEVQIMHRIVSGTINELTGPKDHPQPDLVREVHQRALATNPEERYASADVMRRVIEAAAQPCGGIASPAELAAFLQEIIPGRSKEISNRLSNYKQDITDSISLRMQPSNTPPPVTPKPSIGTLVQAPETLVRAQPLQAEETSEGRKTLLISIIGVVAVIGFIILLLSKSEPDPLPNTQPTPAKLSEIVKPPVSKEVSTPNTKTPPQKSTPGPSSTKAQNKTKSQNTPSKAPPTSPLVKSGSAKPPEDPTEPIVTTPTTTNEAVKTIPVEPVAEPESIKTISEPEIVSKPPPVQMVRVSLMVGAASGTHKGIPVMLDGKTLTEIGSKKLVSLPVGTHELMVIHPDTGKTLSQEAIIKTTTRQLVVKIKGL